MKGPGGVPALMVPFVIIAMSANPSQGKEISANTCKGHIWIKHLASIQSESDSQSDKTSCWFDPSSYVGKRVLRVCNEWGGTAEHGCVVIGTFRTDSYGERELTGVIDVKKTTP
jgi:hypothetical protein